MKLSPPIFARRGFTLLEILVAVVMLALGVSGNALLLTRSLQLHSAGIMQSRAVAIATSAQATLHTGSAASLADTAACDGGDAVACAALAWQAEQLRRASAAASASLPAGTLDVTSSGAATVITITWRDRASLSPRQFVLTVER